MPARTRDTGYISAYPVIAAYTTPNYGRATGGIGAPTAVTISSVNYEYLTFTSTGTLTVTTAGWFDYLAVGGGGGNNNYASGGGGGGGSGCLEIGSIYLDTNQTITIGAGGSLADHTILHTAGSTIIAATSPFGRTVGGNFSFSSSGGKNQLAVGGGVGSVAANASAVFTTAYGKNGGDSFSAANYAAGGGGSTDTVGGNAPSGSTGGTGANGFDVSVFIGGSATYKAAGGSGGASGAGGPASNGGTAGNTGIGVNAAANSGSGGGGGYGTATAGNGGSGICYIRYAV